MIEFCSYGVLTGFLMSFMMFGTGYGVRIFFETVNKGS